MRNGKIKNMNDKCAIASTYKLSYRAILVFRQYSVLQYVMYLSSTYSDKNTTSIPKIFRGNTLEYLSISLIFLTIFRGV